MTDRQLTRRELRDLERAQVAATESGSLPVVSAPPALPVTPDPVVPAATAPANPTPAAAAPAAKTPGRRAAASTTPATVTADSVPLTLSGSITLPPMQPEAPGDLFPRSGPIDVVQDTNSLVIEMPKDITNATMVIADGGVTLTTGSITLPKLDTGEISLVVAAEAADAAALEDKRDQVVTGIEPLPARRHQRSRKRQSVFPTKLRRGMGQVYIVLFSAVLTAGVLGLLVIAYMLGYIKF